MILVETDVSEEWDSRGGWDSIADKAVRSALESSRHATLIGGAGVIEVSVKFTTDDEVRALNAAWRGKDRPTNVLSFPMIDGKLLGRLAGAGEALLGDIVLAHGICVAEAEEKGVAVADHAAHLVVHGMLHLLGYDHDAAETDAEAMEDAERAALSALGIADPYAVREVEA